MTPPIHLVFISEFYRSKPVLHLFSPQQQPRYEETFEPFYAGVDPEASMFEVVGTHLGHDISFL